VDAIQFQISFNMTVIERRCVLK